MNELRIQAIEELNSQPWALRPTVLGTITRSLMGDYPQAALPGRSQQEPRRVRSVGVLPLLGVITQRRGAMMELFGGTSTEEFGRRLDEMVKAKNVGSVVIEADSPGGSVAGVPELAEKIREAAKRKPIIGAVNSMAASGAYWLLSATSEIVITPSGESGSIGVWSAHVDLSEALKKAGEKVTLVAAGKYKVEQSPFAALSAEAKANMQKEVNRYHNLFLRDVGTGRKTSAARVRSEFGQGRMLSPQQAVKVGMADRVGTMESVVAELSGASSPGHAAAILRETRINRLEAGIAYRQQAQADHAERERHLQQLEREVAAHNRN